MMMMKSVSMCIGFMAMAGLAYDIPPACLLSCIVQVGRSGDCGGKMENIDCVCMNLSEPVNRCVNTSCPARDAKMAVKSFGKVCNESKNKKARVSSFANIRLQKRKDKPKPEMNPEKKPEVRAEKKREVQPDTKREEKRDEGGNQKSNDKRETSVAAIIAAIDLKSPSGSSSAAARDVVTSSPTVSAPVSGSVSGITKAPVETSGSGIDSDGDGKRDHVGNFREVLITSGDSGEDKTDYAAVMLDSRSNAIKSIYTKTMSTVLTLETMEMSGRLGGKPKTKTSVASAEIKANASIGSKKPSPSGTQSKNIGKSASAAVASSGSSSKGSATSSKASSAAAHPHYVQLPLIGFSIVVGSVLLS